VALRLAGANTLEQAREVLKRFLKEYNRRFCLLPKQSVAVFKKAPPAVVLHKILCLKETRVVKELLAVLAVGAAERKRMLRQLTAAVGGLTSVAPEVAIELRQY